MILDWQSAISVSAERVISQYFNSAYAFTFFAACFAYSRFNFDFALHIDLIKGRDNLPINIIQFQ